MTEQRGKARAGGKKKNGNERKEFVFQLKTFHLIYLFMVFFICLFIYKYIILIIILMVVLQTRRLAEEDIEGDWSW